MGIGRWTVGVIDAGLDARAHVLRASDLASSVRASVGRAAWGATGLARETRGVDRYGVDCHGRYSGAPASLVTVGNGLYHGDADRMAALMLLMHGFADFEHDMLAAVARSLDPSLMQWWAVTVKPAIDEWHRFYAAEARSYVTRFATSWDTFEEWRDRLVRMRENARVAGIALDSPEPARLPQTYTEQGTRGTGSPLATLWTAVKLILYAFVGLAGFIGLYGVIRDLRHGHTLQQATIGRLHA